MTDPLLYFQDTTEAQATMHFYSTFELDSLAQFGGKTLYGQYHDAAWWKQKFWQRLGSREIVVPCNYVSPHPNEYCLLRVKEVGAGTSLETDPESWWFREPYNSRVDTIIPQDGSISLKLLPGQGKMLNVTVLHPGKTEGNLAHSNQSKLISFPVLNSAGVQVDSIIRYHLVYFKPYSSVAPNSGKNGVYYRRSLPLMKNSPNSNIIWEDEICVSDFLRDNISDPRSPRTIDSASCDYPSIVVRKSGDTLKAYIVYTCANAHNDNMIVETILDVNNTTVTDVIGNALCLYNGKDRNEWGNPVISACAASGTGVGNGNYIAWSDSTYGIVAGWKPTSAKRFTFSATNKDTLHIAWNNSIPNFVFAKHPSFNVYSHIDSIPFEDNCALVWQEPRFKDSAYADRFRSIFYTRLRDSSLHLKKYLPQIFISPQLNVLMNASRTIALLSDSIPGDCDNRFPVIYRSLDSYSFNTGSLSMTNRNDRIYWENYNGDEESCTKICTRGINLKDSNNIAKKWNVYKVSEISALRSHLIQPNISQGIPPNNYSPMETGLLLDVTKSDSLQKIILLPHSLNSLMSSVNGSEYSTYQWEQSVDNNCQLPHLAKHNKIIELSKAWRSRLVYEILGPTPPIITTSAKYFYRKDEEPKQIEGFVGFTSGSSKYYMNLPKMDDRIIGLHLPIEEVKDEEGNKQFVRVEKDTIPSEWFTVGPSAKFQFKCKGTDSSQIKVLIEKKSTGETFNLRIPKNTHDTLGKLCQYVLHNGKDDNYRLLFINRNPNAGYSEELWLEGLPVDTLEFITNREGEARNIQEIDLSNSTYQSNGSNKITLSLNPNPADEEIYVKALLPSSVEIGKAVAGFGNSIEFRVYSQIGTVLLKQEAEPGETITINTSTLPAGVYFIRAEYQYENYFNPVVPVIESFVISR